MENNDKKIKITPVDPESSIPLYFQVYTDLLNRIHSNEIETNTMLPPELELAKAYCVSRQTMRDALKLLEADELIERRAGRGTTVRGLKTRIQHFIDRGFSQHMKDTGFTPSTQVLSVSECIIDDNSPIPLQSKLAAKALEIIRLRLANAEPIGVQYATVIIDQCPELINEDFSEESLSATLMTKYHFLIDYSEFTVGLSPGNEYVCQRLQVPPDTSLLKVINTVFLRNKESIYVATSYFRPDKYEFRISKKW